MKRFYLIDSFRGLASLWILYYHYMPSMPDYRQTVPEFIRFILDNGLWGTEIFFVVSGFVVAIAAEKIREGRATITDFVNRRMRRIYMVFMFSLIFACFIGPAFRSLVYYLRFNGLELYFPQYSVVDWIQLVTLTRIFTVENWNLYVVFSPLNGVYWYIAVIVQIYLVIAAALLSKKHYHKIIITITIISALRFWPPFLEVLPKGTFFYHWINFSLGMGLFYLIRNGYFFRLKNGKPAGAYWLALSAFLVVAFIVLNFFYLRIFVTVTISVAFWFLYPFDDLISKNIISRSLAKLGTFSYTTYLIHKPLQTPAALVVYALSPLPIYLTIPFILAPSALLTCYAWHLFYEKPGSLTASLRAVLSPIKTLKRGFQPVFNVRLKIAQPSSQET